MMSELLEQYEVGPTDESSTSRPNLTSFCSSPDHFGSKAKIIATEKQRFLKDKKH
jgi:hypothetical protein